MLAKITAGLVAIGPWGVLLLAALDSAGVPIIGGIDALVILLAVKDPTHAYWSAGIAVLGSTAGNIALFWAARRGGRRFRDRAAPPGKTRRFRGWFYRYGLATVFIPAAVPILPLPLKVFVITAGAVGVRLWPFMAVVLLARMLRYGGVAYLGIQVGEHSMQYLKDHAAELGALAALLFVVFYLLLRISERFHKAASDLS